MDQNQSASTHNNENHAPEPVTPATTAPTSQSNETKKATQPNSPKTPILLQVLAILMILAGVGYILIGIPLLLLFGLGLIFIIIGVLYIVFALAISKMQHKGYVGGMVMLAIGTIGNLSSFALHNFNATIIVSLVFNILFMACLYLNREKFN